MEEQTTQNVELIDKSIDLKQRKVNDEMKQIEEWTGMKIGNIIFDSDVDDWNVNTSVFDKKVLNKSNLIFLIKDDGNKFGSYVNADINECWNFINDPKSFVFSLKPDEMLKFNIQLPQYAIEVYFQTNTWLLSIGNGGLDGSQDDINIMEHYCEGHDQFSGCKQSSFK